MTLLPKKYKIKVNMYINEDVCLGTSGQLNGKRVIIDKVRYNPSGEEVVDLEYVIKDFNGNIVSSISEELTIDGQISFTKLIDIPFGLKPGEYVIAIILKSGNTVSTTSHLFSISEEAIEEIPFSRGSLMILLLIIIGALTTTLINVIYRFKKINTHKKKGKNKFIKRFRKFYK